MQTSWQPLPAWFQLTHTTGVARPAPPLVLVPLSQLWPSRLATPASVISTSPLEVVPRPSVATFFIWGLQLRLLLPHPPRLLILLLLLLQTRTPPGQPTTAPRDTADTTQADTTPRATVGIPTVGLAVSAAILQQPGLLQLLGLLGYVAFSGQQEAVAKVLFVISCILREEQEGTQNRQFASPLTELCLKFCLELTDTGQTIFFG
mmetsp:Transcript_1394/g.2661  ORF Transcript_1394/g.2661 Transcript_1394/m.2661 type:complete len:205 (-) Transcript_1394:129-743(-)